MIYYIDGVDGDDETGDGSAERPWKTVHKAEAFAVERIALSETPYADFAAKMKAWGVSTPDDIVRARREEPSAVNHLKLFVVGESSGDPAEWTGVSRRVLVLARSAEEAGELVTYHGAGVAEVHAAEPTVLLAEPEDVGE